MWLLMHKLCTYVGTFQSKKTCTQATRETGSSTNETKFYAGIYVRVKSLPPVLYGK